MAQRTPSSPYARTGRPERVVFETSLKPFRSAEPDAIAATARHLLRSWARLAEQADALGVLLWVADGSDILAWSGDLDQPLEWGRYIGFCNIDARPDLYYPGWYQARPGEPFAPDTPALSYGTLRAIIAALKQAAREAFGLELTVGATFDPGPEFAASAFKYHDHPEILYDQPPGVMLAPMHFVTAQAALHADPRPYGGFPSGIPVGTSLGTFLGGQMASLAEAVGYDYLWLSNGFGYSHFAWTPTGELFQQDAWRPKHAARERERTLAFWHDFRAACPALPLEVRGTNYTVGMDLSTDGASHRAIAEAGGLDMAPPNLPVLHADHLAKDVVTYLTRIARTPGERIVYRGYVNDPWFEQNPWYDIYRREPLEIVTALSACRLNADAGVSAPTDLHLLTIDTERGEVLPEEADEMVPHLLRAFDERADAAGPLVWVYPWDEYHDLLEQAPERLPHVFFHDHFIERSVDGGLPLLTVCASDVFVALHQAGRLPDAVYLAPVPLGDWPYASALLEHVRAGGRAVVYGSLEHAPPAWLDALGLTLADDGIEGNLSVECRLTLDHRFQPGKPLRHRGVTCGGGVRECAAEEPLMAVTDGHEHRAYAVVRELGGRLAWLRGTVPFGPPTGPPWFRLPEDRAADAQRPQDWLRALLAELGLVVRQPRQPGQEPVRLFVKRWRGAWVFVGSKPDTTVRARVRTPDGAPVFAEYDTRIVDGCAEESFGKTINSEVRCFVEMADGTVKAKVEPFSPGRRQCLRLTGCVDARVTIYPDPDALRRGEVLLLPRQWADRARPCERVETVPAVVDLARGRLVVERHTGELFVTW